MTEYSVAEAKNNLPRLLDRALAGEEVTITRRGKPIASLVARPEARSNIDRPTSPYDIEWLKQHRVTPKEPTAGADLVRIMRDEARY